jgi:hypothetical protein
MQANVNRGDKTTKRRVSRRGQSDAVEGRIVTIKGAGNDNRNNNDKYDA